MSVPAVAITQGRLVPMVDGQIQRFPRETWRDELALVGPAGYDGIEWIHDEFGGGQNLLGCAGGHHALAEAGRAAHTRVLSGCFDDILNEALWVADAAWQPTLDRIAIIAENLAMLGAGHLVIPLLRQTDIRDERVWPAAARFVCAVVDVTAPHHMPVHLETALRNADLLRFVDLVGADRCRVTFDTGNLVQFGYNPSDELTPLLPVIGSVHIKDSTATGGTVPLGTGDVDFPRIVRQLLAGGYQGLWTVQGARMVGVPDLEVSRGYARFLREQFEGASHA